MSRTGTAFILANRDLEENQFPPLGPNLVRISILEEALENILSADDLQEAIGIAAQALEDPNE